MLIIDKIIYFIFKFIYSKALPKNIEFKLPNGEIIKSTNDKDDNNESVLLFITDTNAVLAMLTDPVGKMAQLYMANRIKIERGTLLNFFNQSILMNRKAKGAKNISIFTKIWYYIDKLTFISKVGNNLTRSKKNVEHHYDVDADFYKLFLDKQMIYSCAYFKSNDQSLEQAQITKICRLAGKLCLSPEDNLLDIGCGWGGTALCLARIAGCKITGITLAKEQIKVAQEKTIELKLQDQVEFRMEDYRQTRGTFDKIVSVGMFEHVGHQYYQTFFDKCYQLLNDNGIMVLHTIGRKNLTKLLNSSWLDQNIFPGSYLPDLQEICLAIEQAHLIVTDVEVMRIHYAHTLKEWRNRLWQHRKEIEAKNGRSLFLKYDIYLAMSESYMRHKFVVYQVQISKRMDAVPITRDYISTNTAKFEKLANDLYHYD